MTDTIIWKDGLEYEVCSSNDNSSEYEYIEVDQNEYSKSIGYGTVKKFTSLGMDQVNIHIMVSQETLDFVYEVLNDRLNDERLKDMHAIVFLGVKPKGRAADGYHSLTSEQYAKLVKFCLDNKFTFGFDSCSCNKFQTAIKGMNLADGMLNSMTEASEPCESLCMSMYISVNGEMWACSFTEEEPNQSFIDVTMIDDFISDVWYSDVAIEFRENSIKNNRQCIVFPMINI